MPAKRLLVIVFVLVIAALACSSGGGGNATPRPVFQDDFSRENNDWSTGEDETALLAYRNGAYVFEIYEGDWLIWGNPRDESYSNVRVEVEARNTGEALDPTFGIICNYADDQNFHFMGIGADGYYAIVRHENGESTVLTDSDNMWLQSDDIEINADVYNLTAECAGNGDLRLLVDGDLIAETSDDTLTEGNVGLFAFSFEEAPVEVQFDNLEVNQLAGEE
jgi:hypothetical protein